ncbi:MAG: hypothetical protein MHPSP_001415, partial [Paramarteilia canceri]
DHRGRCMIARSLDQSIGNLDSSKIFHEIVTINILLILHFLIITYGFIRYICRKTSSEVPPITDFTFNDDNEILLTT